MSKLVRDLMHIGVTTCQADTLLVESVRTLFREGLESLIVLDGNSHAVGMLSRREAIAAFGRSGANMRDIETLTVGEVMRPDIPQVPPDIPATAAAQIMLDQGVREIYLMHHASGISWPAAVLRFEDVLRYLAAESEADVADMGAGAPRKSPIEAFIERYSKAQ
ncbi:MAG: CBS domain-containing protein [Anaerolineae bacterium]|jgi:CBS-domain-containing membrane protein